MELSPWGPCWVCSQPGTALSAHTVEGMDVQKVPRQRGHLCLASSKIPRRAFSIPGETSWLVKSAVFPVAEQSQEIRLLFSYETHYSYGKKPPVTLWGLDQPHKEHVPYKEEGLFAIKVMEFPRACWRNK